ncbi:ATP-dependent RNA helicase dbp6, partial [Perkinsus olseni]
EHAHRLARLLQICVTGDESIEKALRIREFSAALDQKHRVSTLEAFRTGRIHTSERWTTWFNMMSRIACRGTSIDVEGLAEQGEWVAALLF